MPAGMLVPGSEGRTGRVSCRDAGRPVRCTQGTARPSGGHLEAQGAAVAELALPVLLRVPLHRPTDDERSIGRSTVPTDTVAAFAECIIIIIVVVLAGATSRFDRFGGLREASSLGTVRRRVLQRRR